MKHAAAVMLCLAMTVLPARRADACSCIERGAACEVFFDTAAVFLGRVLSIENLPTGSSSGPAFLNSRRVTIEVLESFRGVSSSQVTVTTGAGGGDCGYPFRVDETYLVFADQRDDQQIAVSLCSKTRPLREAAEDLAFARSTRSPSNAGAVLKGFVGNRDAQGRRDANASRYAPVPGIDVRLDCEGIKRSAVTDARGEFEIDRLPVGTCSVDLSVPSGMYLAGGPDPRVVIRNLGACASMTATLAYDGRIRGRIVDAARSPVSGLTIEAWSQPPPRFGVDAAATAVTDADGMYELSQVAPGAYLVAVNARDSDFRGHQPWTPAYLPGTEDRSLATTVPLAPGERLDLVDFVLPSSLRFVAVTGTARTSSGEPVRGMNVLVYAGEPLKTRIMAMVKTDEQGRFHVAVLDAAQVALVLEEPLDPAHPASRRREGRVGLFTASGDSAPLDVIVR